MLKKWFIVIESQIKENNLEVILTDGKVWYIDFDAVAFVNPSDLISWNAWFITSSTDLYTRFPTGFKKEASLNTNDVFFLKNMRLIMGRLIEVKMVSWSNRGRTWYIDVADTQLTCISHLKYNILENYFQFPTAILNFFTPYCQVGNPVFYNYDPVAEIPVYTPPVINTPPVNQNPSSTTPTLPNINIPQIDLPDQGSDLDLLKALEDIFK